MSWLRGALLTLIGLNIALMALNITLYPAFFAQPGALFYLLEPLASLIVYAVIAFLTTRRISPQVDVASRVGLLFGLLTGCLWLVNLTLETFTNIGGGAGILATAPFLLGGFLLWGVAGVVAAWRTGSIGSGLLAAIWSAMIFALLTIAYGWTLPLVAQARLRQQLVNDPDFLRSRWTDLQAFVLANSFDSGFSHLLGALVIGLTLGAIGAVAAVWLKGSRQPRSLAA
ncbi:MAG TPA: hypothetical protein VHR15_20590 [Ktedonobacterales bacterium]|jgi:hypothetical protein|nr:hypothetical protein [Ktedonobacterales bacterium]